MIMGRAQTLVLREGSYGDAVSGLQWLLNLHPALAGVPLAIDGSFGPFTDARVRAFQSMPPERLSADGIVGPLTWRKLKGEDDLDELEGLSRLITPGTTLGVGGQGGGTAPVAKFVVVSEMHPVALRWARQVANGALLKGARIAGDVVTVTNNETVVSACRKIEQAVRKAGRLGGVILSVGHGVASVQAGANRDEGWFNLAPGVFIVGMNTKKGGPAHQVKVFYERRSGGQPSDKEHDEGQARNGSKSAETRLESYAAYRKLGQTIRSTHLAFFWMVTCRVGSATGLIDGFRSHMGTTIVCYRRRRTMMTDIAPGRERVYLEGDTTPGKLTNIPLHEEFPPVRATKGDLKVFPI